MKKLVCTFGSHQHKEIGRVNIRIAVSESLFFTFEADVVDVDVPLLLGIDVIKSSRLVLDFSKKEVRSEADGWNLPLIRKKRSRVSGMDGQHYLYLKGATKDSYSFLPPAHREVICHDEACRYLQGTFGRYGMLGKKIFYM